MKEKRTIFPFSNLLLSLSLSTQGAIEEKIVERAFKKLFLDAMVIQQGRLMEKNKSANKEELLEMIRFGADEVVRLGDVESPDFDIEEVRHTAMM